MKKKESWIAGLMSNFFMIFSLEVFFISIMGISQIEEMNDYSTLYSLGNKGIAYDTICQLGLNAFLIALLVSIIMSDRIFGKLMIVWRSIILLAAIILLIIVFIIAFDWFPIDFLPGWIGFFASFGVCFAGSTAVMLIKTKMESKKYEELLEHYKNNKGMNDTDTEN